VAAAAAIAAGAAPDAGERVLFNARLPGGKKAAAGSQRKPAAKRERVRFEKPTPAPTASRSRRGKAPEAGDDGRRGADSDAPSSDVSEAATEEDDEPAPKKARKEPERNRRAASAGSLLFCLACKSSFPEDKVLDGLFCPACHLIYTTDSESLSNRVRAATLGVGAAPEAGSVHSSQLDSSSSGSAKPKLGAYEAELKRLCEIAGAPAARYQAPDTIPHDAAIGAMRGTFVGTTFARQSEWLTKLIRSGHFKELSLALPVTNADTLRRKTAEAKGSKVVFSSGGELTTTAAATVERHLTSLSEFLRILVVTIIPTLFDRPRALLDWLELARSVIDMDERDGWGVAGHYLIDLLGDCVPTGAPIGKFDHGIYQAVRATAPPRASAPAAAAPGRGATPVGHARERPAWVDECAAGVCRDWNLSGCALTDCRYAHKCCWRDCPSPGDGHRAATCEHKPPGFKPSQAGRRGGGPSKAPGKGEPRRK